MDSTRREELRATFEDDLGDLYHRARPRYPAVLFDDLLEITGIAPPSSLLEIGSGTGIATVPLAERGFRITGIEPSEDMARVARTNLLGWESVEIATTRLEDFDVERDFDAVLAFSAFHWLDPSTRLTTVASLLADAGWLIVADARLVPNDDPFFAESENDYREALGERAEQPGAPELASLRDELGASGHFVHVAERRYEWSVVRSAREYIELLDTFPWYRALDPSDRAELFARLGHRIEERRSGVVSVPFRAVLDVGRLVDS